MARPLKKVARAVVHRVLVACGEMAPWLYNWCSRRRYSHRNVRKLEIGPGPERVEGLETLNIAGGWGVDYVADASRRLPFRDGMFDLVYASHVLEHVAWYQTENALSEWVRVLRPGGFLEVWVPDGIRICRAFVDAETIGADPFQHDTFSRFNDERDPAKWANGRLFTYGDGTGDPGHWNWHRSIFSERYLQTLFRRAGLVDIRRMLNNEVRGYDHGWINLGVCGRKPDGRAL